MEKQPRHRPYRHFENQQRLLIDCELSVCPHCGAELKPTGVDPIRWTVVGLGKGAKKCPEPIHHIRRNIASRSWN
jgi:hypothetical protein